MKPLITSLSLLMLFAGGLVLDVRAGSKRRQNFRADMVREILEEPEAIKERVKKALKAYFKNPEFIRVTFFPTPLSKFPLGYFSRIDVHIKSAKVKALRVKEGNFRFHGLRINLNSLYRDGKMRLRSVEKSHYHFLVTEKSLNEAIREKRLPVINPYLSIEPGRLSFSAKFRTLFIKSHIETKGRLAIQNGTQIYFYPERLKMNSVPIPGFLRKALSRKINPIIDLDDFDFIKSIDKIILKQGLIEFQG
jgi:hypothetical protein